MAYTIKTNAKAIKCVLDGFRDDWHVQLDFSKSIHGEGGLVGSSGKIKGMLMPFNSPYVQLQVDRTVPSGSDDLVQGDKQQKHKQTKTKSIVR